MTTLNPNPFGEDRTLKARVGNFTAAFTRPARTLAARIKGSYVGTVPAWRIAFILIVVGLIILGAIHGGGGEGGGG